MSSQLVAYSGFSATNYIQEPYSADLDFGTGEFSVGSWVSMLYGSDAANFIICPEDFTSNWTLQTINVEKMADNAFKITSTAAFDPFLAQAVNIGTSVFGKTFTFSAEIWTDSGQPTNVTFFLYDGDVSNIFIKNITLTDIPTRYSFTQAFPNSVGNILNCRIDLQDTLGVGFPIGNYIYARNPKINQGVTPGVYTAGQTAQYNPIAPIADRSAAAGPSIKFGIEGSGRLVATAFDGTTTRTVTTTSAYNNGIFTKAVANYTVDGKLAINVNGVEVAAVMGTPLLSLNTETPRHNLLVKTEALNDTQSWTLQTGVVIRQINGAEWEIDFTSSADNLGIYQVVSDIILANSPYSISVEARLVTDSVNNKIIVEDPVGGAGSVSVFTTLTTAWTKISCVGKNTAAYSRGIWVKRPQGGASIVRIRYLQLEFGSVVQQYQRVNTPTDYDTSVSVKASLTIGNSRSLDAPFPGSITMLKLGATVPTPEQALWMYEQEKFMFAAGAQVTLPEASPVLDLSYDESQDKWVTLQAGHESSFTGLVRTASATPSSGSFSKVVAAGGIKALAHNAANPGVDIQIPAYSLREELVKRSEAASKASKSLSLFDFDAVTGQVDFVLPSGWTATEVLNAGAIQREGATKAWTILFDGFRETIRFGVAPGNGVWVQIKSKKG